MSLNKMRLGLTRPANNNDGPRAVKKLPAKMTQITGGVREEVNRAALLQRSRCAATGGYIKMEIVYGPMKVNPANLKSYTYEQAATALMQAKAGFPKNVQCNDNSVFLPVAKILLQIGNVMVQNYTRFFRDEDVQDIAQRVMDGISFDQLVELLKRKYPYGKHGVKVCLTIVK